MTSKPGSPPSYLPPQSRRRILVQLFLGRETIEPAIRLLLEQVTGPDPHEIPVPRIKTPMGALPGVADLPVRKDMPDVGLIYAIDASHIGVVGPGKIVGNPALGGRPNAQNPLRHPALIEPIHCTEILLDGFSTSHRLMWSIHPTNSENIVITNLTIRSTGGNGDGIDIDSCKHVRIEGCDIATGDDCISIKSGRGSEAYALMQTSEDILIRNCTMADSIFACIGIGSETSGGIRNVRIEHCKFTGARTYAIYIKTRVGRGAFIEDIVADDLDVSGTRGGFLNFNLLSSGIQDQVPVPGDGSRARQCPVPWKGESRDGRCRGRSIPWVAPGREAGERQEGARVGCAWGTSAP